MIIRDKIILVLFAFIIAILMAAPFTNKKPSLCDNVCVDFQGCKEEVVVASKWHNYIEIECKDGTKLQITKDNNK